MDGFEHIEVRARLLRPAQSRAGLAPWIMLAGGLHVGAMLFIPLVTTRPTATASDATVQLVSLPPPAPQPAVDPTPPPAPESAAAPAPAPEPALPPPYSATPTQAKSDPAPPEPPPTMTPPDPEPPPAQAASPPALPPPDPVPSPEAELPANQATPSGPVAVSPSPPLHAAPSHPPARPPRVARLRTTPATQPPAAAVAEPAPAPPAGPPASATPPAASAAANASFESRLLAAVEAEAQRHYPSAARLMGVTGQAIVSFQYHDGLVHEVALELTSGSPMLDRAAIAAVEDASYPQPPADLLGHTLNRLVHVRFSLTAD